MGLWSGRTCLFCFPEGNGEMMDRIGIFFLATAGTPKTKCVAAVLCYGSVVVSSSCRHIWDGIILYPFFLNPGIPLSIVLYFHCRLTFCIKKTQGNFQCSFSKLWYYGYCLGLGPKIVIFHNTFKYSWDLS
jgi:hypothetical protein